MPVSTRPHVASLPPLGRAASHVSTGSTDSTHGHHSRHATTSDTASRTGGGSSLAPPPSLTDVHAQRVVAVLTEAMAKVEILMNVPPVMDRRATNMLGKELAHEIDGYNRLRHAVDGSSDIASEHLRADLHSAVRNVCRAPLHSADARQELALYNAHDTNQAGGGNGRGRPSSGAASSHHLGAAVAKMEALKQLLASAKLLTVEKLTRSAQDEENKMLELQRVIEREKKIREEVDVVRTQLEKAKKERLAEINVKNDAIRKLKDELKDIKQTAEDVARKLEMRTKNKEETDHAHFSEREATLLAETKALQAFLAATVAAHREEELNLRKRRFKVESEVDAWISKYDQDMEEKQAELDDLSAIYAEEKAQLDDLQARHDELNREYQRILEERKWQEEVRAKLEAERAKRAKCATMIQALWRGHVARKLLKEQKEKKKKGGKGGRKKKK
ncbi:hypothetical protein H9P43_002996 [Blastocladiella emersonii ATCC 22665]|nr:hypothetical protein H9P43_002996 [Blastocladiella emersonii ATCC 22665]